MPFTQNRFLYATAFLCFTVLCSPLAEEEKGSASVTDFQELTAAGPRPGMRMEPPVCADWTQRNTTFLIAMLSNHKKTFRGQLDFTEQIGTGYREIPGF